MWSLTPKGKRAPDKDDRITIKIEEEMWRVISRQTEIIPGVVSGLSLSSYGRP